MAGILTCIITHGKLSNSIKEVVDKLTASSAELYCYSNQEHVLEELESEISKLIKDKSPEKTYIFTDLVGGSCWLAANKIKHNNNHVSIIGGVNVPMLVSFIINKDRLSENDLIQKILEDAKKGIISK